MPRALYDAEGVLVFNFERPKLSGWVGGVCCSGQSPKDTRFLLFKVSPNYVKVKRKTKEFL